ncbi:MAG: hypothetical protein ACQESP_09750 [Candidatus Muiribacteriota bacterium]
MKKTLVFLTIFCMLFLTANAREAYYQPAETMLNTSDGFLMAGDLMITGDSGLLLDFEDTDNKMVNFTIERMTTDTMSLGGEFSYTDGVFTFGGGGSNTAYGLFGNYYLSNPPSEDGAANIPYFGLFFGDNGNDTGYGIHVGYKMFVSETVGLDAQYIYRDYDADFSQLRIGFLFRF